MIYISIHQTTHPQAFLFYAGGILDDEECFAMPFAKPSTCAAAVDHNVLIVGYDSDLDTGVDYWCVRACGTTNIPLLDINQTSAPKPLYVSIKKTPKPKPEPSSTHP